MVENKEILRDFMKNLNTLNKHFEEYKEGNFKTKETQALFDNNVLQISDVVIDNLYLKTDN